MPTWLKVVLGLLLVGFLAFGAFVIFIFNMGRQMSNPAESEKTLHQMVNFEDPLPADWKYTVNLNMAGIRTVGLANSSSATTITFVEAPNPRHAKAEDFISDPKLLKSHGAQGAITFESRGVETIGGQSAPYVRGVTADGQRVEMAAVSSDRNALIIQIYEKQQSKYCPELARPVLDKIKGFIL